MDPKEYEFVAENAKVSSFFLRGGVVIGRVEDSDPVIINIIIMLLIFNFYRGRLGCNS